MIAAIIIGCVGILFIVFSILFIKFKKIDLLQEYHRDKVKEEDKNIVCNLMGIGMLIIGLGLIVTSVIFGITESVLSFIALGFGFLFGLLTMLYTTIKYNR
jgi:hypothetical protein